MFYKPKFCCQCAERIDSAERKLWTSRRFCELCATEFGMHDWLPRIIIGMSVLFGLFGIGNYLQPSEKQSPIAPRQLAVANVKSHEPPKSAAQVSTGSGVRQTAPTDDSVSQVNAFAPPKSDLKIEKAAASPESAEKVYFCGAPTQKGTMCSRRMKKGGRCWQHEGQAAMLPKEKLLAAR